MCLDFFLGMPQEDYKALRVAQFYRKMYSYSDIFKLEGIWCNREDSEENIKK